MGIRRELVLICFFIQFFWGAWNKYINGGAFLKNDSHIAVKILFSKMSGKL
jgi:hypothetical protein